MSVKDDIKDVKRETKNLKNRVNQQSLASEILQDYKRDNQILKALLLVSILVNVLIAIL